MQPVKPEMDVQSNRPAVPMQNRMSKKKIMPQDDDKCCQVNNEAVCTDKKCQATKCYQKINKNCPISDMQSVKPKMDMQPIPRLAKKSTRKRSHESQASIHER